MAITEPARAKLNLTLSVLGRRSDGYHELESLVTFADLHDLVTLEPGEGRNIVVAGPFANYLSGENLLIRALALLRDADPGLRLGSVRLDKNIPVVAGLGGGSADAAALLRAVERANPQRAASVAWLEIAGRLGADVPVCLAGRPAVMRGKGERVAPVAALPAMAAVLVNPRQPLATADVFAALAAGPAPRTAPASPPLVLSDASAAIAHMRDRGNDLERPALALLPVIGEMKAALAAAPDCRLAAMSGSGPTCFGIFAGKAQARRAAETIAREHPHWWVAATTLAGADGPTRHPVRGAASR
jgi:4-diphosphocytidyl-2-C-methyl-D-erythritol kinase